MAEFLSPFSLQTTPASLLLGKSCGWIASTRELCTRFMKSRIFGPLNSLIPFTIVLFVVTLLAMGLVLYLGARRVFSPLANLTDITHRFANGDFSQRADVRSKDEIGMLGQSFNQMAEDLSTLYRSLERKVEERTRQIHTAAEVAQRITSTANLDELLNWTVQLIVDQFSFYQASIFMLDQRGRFAVLQASYGPAAQEMLARGHRLETGSTSIIGWVTANKQPRVASDVSDDPVHFKNELLPETRSEVGIPISLGNLVLGALDVQSTAPDAFGPDTIVMLQLIASQIAVAIQNVGLLQTTHVDFQDLERLQRSSSEIVAAESKSEALQTLARILGGAPYSALVLSLRGNQLEPEGLIQDDKGALSRIHTAVHMLEERLGELMGALAEGPILGDTDFPSLPVAVSQFARHLGYQAVAFLPIMGAGKLVALVAMGAHKRGINDTGIRPYANLAELAGSVLDRIKSSERQRRELSERESLTTVNQAMAESSAEIGGFFNNLHEQIRRNIGDNSFLVVLYDKATQAITIPYMYEDGRVEKIEAFPLGEGLSSILIRSGKPLLLAKDVDKSAAALGVRTLGRPPRSWMGAPMIIHGETIGGLILQDFDHEQAFDEDNFGFFVSLTNQVAAVLYNSRLLEESRARTLQLETAAEIARDISGSLNLDELLAKAVTFIRERFDFYHASIFLLDGAGEFALIREATGEAGAQMKRVGYKLAVGSKSIVGYVAGRGEPLVVSDTAKDATYYANPLLPGTRSEAAMPLKVGERIVGVMDVQSAHPYAFGSDNLRTLRILADQLSVAVVNSELFAETQEHLSQHRLLHHITTSAASGTTLEEALESAVTGLQVTLGGDRVAIMLMDREKKTLEVKAAAGYSEDILHLRVPLGSGITGWAAAHRRALRVDNVSEDPRYIQASANSSSELAIPLLYRNEVLGVLNAESEQAAAYTQDDEEMLGTLGGSLAAIIANARLLEQIRAQADRERTIYEITSKIRRSTNMETILSTTVSELTKAVGARQARIQIVADARRGQWQPKGRRGMTMNQPAPKGLASPGGNGSTRVYENWRERFVRPMLFGALGFGLIALILGLTTAQGVVQNAVFVISYVLLMAVTFLQFPYWARIGVFLLIVYGLALSELFSTGILGDSVFFFLALVMFATLMLSPQAGAVSLLLTLFTLGIVGWLVQSGGFRLLSPNPMIAHTADWLSTGATTLLFSITFILGLRQLQIEFVGAQTKSAEMLQALDRERALLEKRVEARTVQLTAVNAVGSVANSILNPQELAGRVANLITDQFGYYYTALFLVDETGEQAWLYSATGEAGRLLKENKHHLRVGGNSMVGMAISTAKARVALDVGAEPVRFQNPLLPYTRSEIALPLTVGNRVLGALDVQSTKAGAFGQQEIDTLQGMANQVGIALENARLFEESQKSLEEIQAIQRQYILDAWRPLSGNENLDYKLGDEDLPPNTYRLEVPLAVRDEVIGRINLAGESDWTPEQRNLVETVSSQAALALENARLVEQSQTAAMREHQLAEITGKVWGSTTIEGILQTALNELGHALELSEATIELKMDTDDQ